MTLLFQQVIYLNTDVISFVTHNEVLVVRLHSLVPCYYFKSLIFLLKVTIYLKKLVNSQTFSYNLETRNLSTDNYGLDS